MRIIKKNVYYCEYCNKKSLRSVIIHEKHCTANPNRICRLCEGKSIKEIIDKYEAMFEVNNIQKVVFGGCEVSLEVKYLKEFTLDDIRNELDYNCPNCLLAIIRCLGLNRWYFDKKFKFDYQKELQGWWAAVNEEAREEDERSNYY